jgi:hypothetical protein
MLKLRLPFSMRLVIPLSLLALMIAPAAFSGAISINSSCELGSCASPDVLGNPGSIPEAGFSYVYTFANTDSYLVTGSFGAANDAGGTFIGGAGPFFTYLGNSTASASGTDVLSIDFLQGYTVTNTSGTYNEGIAGFFAGPLAPGSSLSAQFFADGQALPVLGPYTFPGSIGSPLITANLSGLSSPLLLDFRLTATFDAGSGIGSVIAGDVVPEPSSFSLLGMGLLAALAGVLRRKRVGHYEAEFRKSQAG